MDAKHETIPQEAVAEKKSVFKRKNGAKNGKSRKKRIRNCIIALLFLVLLFSVFKFAKRGKDEASADVILTKQVEQGDITVYLSGSGMIEAMDAYDVVAMVKGDVLSAPFEEGEIVHKDDTLYVFDSTTAQQYLQTQQNAYASQKILYEKEQKNRSKFSVTAPVTGYVKDVDAALKIGDEVNANTRLATVDSADVEVTIPFAASAADAVRVGATAQLSSSKYMTNSIWGRVSAVDSVRGSRFNATVTFTNPGQIEEGDVLGAAVGGIVSAGTGNCRVAHAVETEIRGELASIQVKNGDYVTAGTVLFTLDDADTRDALRQSELNFSNSGISLQQAYDALDDYTIQAPITGTVIQKNYKAGDTVGNSVNSAVLATIADISQMKFTMNVDELDISKVSLGQRVEVVADAIENEVFEGVITKIIQQGSGTSGVTTYPVEVTIAEPGALMIGMNVTGTMVVSSAKAVLKVPVEAVSLRSGKSFVSVLKDSVKKKVYDNLPQGDVKDREKPNNKEADKYTFTDDDFELREVTTGVSSDDEIEITSGLTKGEYVKIVQTVNTWNSAMMGFNNMHNSMRSGGSSGMGGAPGGGMGGAPGGR